MDGYIGVPTATDQTILPCEVRSARRVSTAGMGVCGLVVGREGVYSAVWILFQVGWTRSKNKHGRRVRAVFGIFQKGRARLRRSV